MASNRPRNSGMFQKGKSGNLKGRPKGSKKQKNSTPLLESELGTYITIMENGRKKRVTMDAAVHKQLLKMAIEGDIQAMRLVMQLKYLRGSQRKNILIENIDKTVERASLKSLTIEEAAQIYQEALKNAKSAE